MSLPTFFCSARTVSNAAIDARRRSSAATRSSTSSVGSPRRRWAARSASASSRRSRGSITGPAYLPVGWPMRDDPLRWCDPPATERVSPLSFDLRRAEPTRRARYYWAIAVPSVVFALLAILVAAEHAGLQSVDDRVASWGFDVGGGSDGLVDFSTWF